MQFVSDVSLRAADKWEQIYKDLNIDVGVIGRHTKCPIPGCTDGGGKDRFRITDVQGRGNYYCNQCGYGDGLSLVSRVLGVSIFNAAKRVQACLDGAPPERAQAKSASYNQAELDERLMSVTSWLLENSVPTNVHPYLSAKGIEGIEVDVLPDGRIVLPILNKSGEVITCQTIEPSGKKRFLKGSKLKGAYGAIWGSPESLTAIVGEGLATCVTGKLIYETMGYDDEPDVYVALMASNLSAPLDALKNGLRDHVRTLYFLADNDPTGKGFIEALKAAQLAANKGLRAYIVMPPESGDWNDIYCQYGMEVAKEMFHDACVRVEPK